MAALLSDKAEAIPLRLEDPLFVVEGFADERRQHRSISRIHAFLSPRHAALGTPATIAAWGASRPVKLAGSWYRRHFLLAPPIAMMAAARSAGKTAVACEKGWTPGYSVHHRNEGVQLLLCVRLRTPA